MIYVIVSTFGMIWYDIVSTSDNELRSYILL